MSPATEAAQQYAAQLAQMRPHLIQSDEEADAIQTLVDQLLAHPDRSEEDRQFLAFLGRLILVWENENYPPIDVEPIELIKHLLDENDLHQRDLVGSVFPTESVASEVLSRKRRLTYEFVGRLSHFFGVSPALFYA